VAARATVDLLTVDLGNSSMKLVLWTDGSPGPVLRYTGGEVPADIPPDVTAIGVRVPGVEAPALSWLPEVAWVGERIELPGTVLYDRPGEMGGDRRVVCFGALATLGPSLVVDCGTAVTLTHVDGAGALRGLAITVGRRTLYDAFAASAPTLAAFIDEAAAPVAGIPKGTRDNLSIGLDRGWSCLVAGLVTDAEERLACELGRDAIGSLVFAGSDGSIACQAVGRGTHDEHLIHRGLSALARGHRKT